MWRSTLLPVLPRPPMAATRTLSAVMSDATPVSVMVMAEDGRGIAEVSANPWVLLNSVEVRVLEATSARWAVLVDVPESPVALMCSSMHPPEACVRVLPT